MTSDSILAVTLSSGDGRVEESDDAILSLREELAAVPELRIALNNSDEPSAGAKSISGSWQEILIALGATGALLPTALGVLRAWLLRQPPTTTIHLKSKDIDIHFNGASSASEIETAVAGLITRLS